MGEILCHGRPSAKLNRLGIRYGFDSNSLQATATLRTSHSGLNDIALTNNSKPKRSRNKPTTYRVKK